MAFNHIKKKGKTILLLISNRHTLSIETIPQQTDMSERYSEEELKLKNDSFQLLKNNARLQAN